MYKYTLISIAVPKQQENMEKNPYSLSTISFYLEVYFVQQKQRLQKEIENHYLALRNLAAVSSEKLRPP